ncbi:uncharacterized protein LOC129599314 [Paramacrobiotus metropolitanus]|uniref:uncharacterized protein LOC129599314 n=1 Tax=Paramacrobiotus metropolitanus TaxID=2943436 RepID=UPI00244637C3|nr:uncharacterized protein LOC129599314 [Paramacrobiotus metropolitanus]
MSNVLLETDGADLPCFFHDLPDESVLHILAFLDIIDRTNCTVVCKRWADISKDPRLQKTVIFDLTKWETHHPLSLLPRPPVPDAEARREAAQVENEWRRQLLQRFWTAKTRHVIFRRPPGTAVPNDCWIKMGIRPGPPGEGEGSGEEVAAGWHFLWGNIYHALLALTKLLPAAPEGGAPDGTECLVTVQDVHMLTGDLSDLLPKYVKTVHLENVSMKCYFYTGFFHPLDKPPQVTRTVLVDKAVVMRENGEWPWLDEPAADFSHFLTQIRRRKMEFFSRFLPPSMTADERHFLEEKLQSAEPIGWTLSCFLRKGVQLLGDDDIHPLAPINTLGLTLDRVGTFPRWLQYLMVELLKDPSIAIFPNL